MKAKLCKAFCDELVVRDVPAGLAVSTPFVAPDGDRVSFFIVKRKGAYALIDDGLTLPTLEASGVDLRSGTRNAAWRELSSEYGVSLDREDKEFYIDGLGEDDVPAAALRFLAFSLRVRDFLLMSEFRVATTFREDARQAIAEALGGEAAILENEVVSPLLSEFPADFVLRAADRAPVGVFLGTSDNRVLEALFLQMRAKHEVQSPCVIVALLENAGSVSARVRQQAMNRLDAVAEFRGDERSAAQRITKELFRRGAAVH